MKRVCMVAMLLILILSLAGCQIGAAEPSSTHAISSYRNIPGVTPEEIAAIEALKSEHVSFSYGYLTTTESFQQADGTYTGFAIDVCALLSDLFQIPFAPKLYADWTDLRRDIDEGITDFSGEFTYTEERALLYDMTMPIAGRGLNVYTLTSNPEIESESELNGKRVGLLGGEETAALITGLYPDISFEIVNVAGFTEAAEMLTSGEVDAFITDSVSDTMFAAYDHIQSKGVFQFVYAPITITTRKAELQPVISVIDKYLDAGGMDTMFSLYNKSSDAYKKHKLSQSFTDEEEAYLADLRARNAQVNVALMHDAYPASFYNTVENRYDGAAYDILAEVSDLTGIVFNSDAMPVEKPLSEILVKLKTGEVSMMPQLLYSESRKDDFIWSDVSYITTNYALLSKSDYPDLQPYQVYYATVGTVNESVHEEVFEESFPGHEKTKAYQTGDEAFEALENGEIDLLMLSETMLLVQTNYHERPGYKVNLTFNKTLDTLFGFNKDETILRDVFDKTLAYIDVKGIEESWLSRTYDYQNRIYRDAIPYIVLFGSLLLTALLVVFLFFIKNRRLSKNLEETVNERTRELENKTASLSTIYKSIPDLVFSKDINSIYTSCNPSFEKFAGMTEAELIGKSDMDIFKIDEGMAALFIQADKEVLDRRGLEKIEELITYPDGARRLMETIKTPLIKNDEVIGMMGIARDITERKEAETALERRLEQQRLMAALLQSFIADGNADEKITDSLRMIGEFMGTSRIVLMELDGEALHYLHEWDNSAQGTQSKLGTHMVLDDAEMKITTAFSQRTITHFSLDDAGQEGGLWCHRPEDVTNFLMLPIFVEDNIWGVLVFSHCGEHTPWTFNEIDLGEMVAGILSGALTRQSMDAKLIEAKELAEQNSKAKSDFLSRMSHEMRTPMNAIIGMTSIAKGSDEMERKDYCLDKIESASTHLLGVINDVLDISKIEAGKFELSHTDFSLEKMLVKLTNVVNFRMEEKKQSFTVRVDNDVPPAIVSDEQRLSQVITNLLGNAIKFTPENGAISLFVRNMGCENGTYTLQFEVKDTGIGISQAQQEKLFTSFEQADGSISRKYGGTGLGLSISKHIVEMMGGQIGVQSKVSEGSSFIFTIRAQEGNCQADLSGANMDLRGLRILAVDDDEDVRECFLGFANAYGFQCDVAASGVEACELIKTNGPYDVCFVDWKMDGMDGIELTKWIKDRYSENAVVIMISSVEWSHIEADAKQAGVDRFIPKPLFASVIAECIHEYASAHKNSEAEDHSEPEENESYRGMRILLAEDIDINREIVMALLEPTGLQIDCAENGNAAYEMFKANPDYDMIFMDIHMPEVDGYTATKMIRALPDPRAKTVPIIAMTANVFREDIERCIEAGMNAHVGKPIDLVDLMAKLKQYLHVGSQA